MEPPSPSIAWANAKSSLAGRTSAGSHIRTSGARSHVLDAMRNLYCVPACASKLISLPRFSVTTSSPTRPSPVNSVKSASTASPESASCSLNLNSPLDGAFQTYHTVRLAAETCGSPGSRDANARSSGVSPRGAFHRFGRGKTVVGGGSEVPVRAPLRPRRARELRPAAAPFQEVAVTWSTLPGGTSALRNASRTRLGAPTATSPTGMGLDSVSAVHTAPSASIRPPATHGRGAADRRLEGPRNPGGDGS